MSVEDRISQLIWKSEAETTVGVPPKVPHKTKSELELSQPEPENPKPESTRPRPETIYFEPEPIEDDSKPSV